MASVARILSVLFSGSYSIATVLVYFSPTLSQIFGKAVGVGPIHILFGEDMEYENLRSTGFVFTRFNQGISTGVVGVIGPARMNFPLVIPYVKYVGDLLSKAGAI